VTEEKRVPDEPGIPDAAQSDPGYDSAGVPTFESVREKIDSRYAAALGAREIDALDSEAPEDQAVEEQYEERQRAAAERLAQIREAMRSEES
jgi:phage shock protein A